MGPQATTLGAAVTLSEDTPYWWCYTNDKATSSVLVTVATSSNSNSLKNSGAAVIGTAANSSAAGAMPASLGTVTGTTGANVPLIKLRARLTAVFGGHIVHASQAGTLAPLPVIAS